MSTGQDFTAVDTRQANEVPYEIELHDDGEPNGLFVRVLGQHCDTVSEAINREVNERRRKLAIQAARAAKARPDSAEFESVESDIAFGQRLSAVRIHSFRKVGDTEGLAPEQLLRFRGDTADYTPARGLVFCQKNPEYASQILEASNSAANFMKVSSPK
jgi:hypothetical protein